MASLEIRVLHLHLGLRGYHTWMCGMPSLSGVVWHLVLHLWQLHLMLELGVIRRHQILLKLLLLLRFPLSLGHLDLPAECRVVSGHGRVQRWGGPVEEIRPGDVIWFAPGEKHWHGATPTTAMTHIAIQEQLDGKAVDWMEHVTEEQYEA